METVHADALRSLLEKALSDSDISGVSASMGRGRFELSDSSGLDRSGAIKAAVSKVEQGLGFPLAYAVISRGSVIEEGRTPGDPGGGEDEAAQARNPGGGNLYGGQRVAFAAMGPMPFIKLSGGQIIFEGGELPDGSVLERITLDALTVKKNGQTSYHQLGGSSD
jgi:hypothetical protein